MTARLLDAGIPAQGLVAYAGRRPSFDTEPPRSFHVAHRHLSAEMNPRLRLVSRQTDLWVDRVVTPQQDLSALF